MTRTFTRLSARLAVGLVAALAFSGATAIAAHAEDGYRFWGYFQWKDGAWAFASKGPDQIVPADGSVEGWRFAVAPQSVTRTPRANGDFAAICRDAPAETGKKRVALVIDAGTTEDAQAAQPPAAKGVCVVTHPAATGARILAAAATVRVEKGQTCAIDGYPATGCGDAVKNVTVPEKDAPVTLAIAAPVGSSHPATATATPTAETGEDAGEASGSSAWKTLVPSVIVGLLIAAGGFWLTRRRTRARQDA